MIDLVPLVDKGDTDVVKSVEVITRVESDHLPEQVQSVEKQ